MSQQFSMGSMVNLTVEELAEYLQNPNDSLQLIDVRESQEVAIAAIEGSAVLSLSKFADWSDQITTQFDPHQETIVMCHHGVRSAQMCQWLLNIGFTNVKNVAGGIDAYSLRIDPAIPRY
jgi:rhodanese-related sulfurtransferase